MITDRAGNQGSCLRRHGWAGPATACRSQAQDEAQAAINLDQALPTQLADSLGE